MCPFEHSHTIQKEKTKKTLIVFSFFLFTLLFFFPFLSYGESCVACPTGNVIFVDKDVATPGDGSSWATAFSEVREALDTAHVCPNITEIWVAEGTYTPSLATSSATANRIIFFIMKNDLALYGGFNGTETNLDQRDWRTNITTLSGDLLGDDDYSTMPATNNDENAYHVIFNFNNLIDSSAVLDGFHVVGGNSNIAPPNHVGGGLYNKQASPTVKNCSFYGNNAGYGGGGNYNDKSTITLENCIFYNNTGAYRGGAMYSDQTTQTMTNCTFFNNHAIMPDMGVGGALFNNWSNPVMTNCTFLNNSATHGGGALSNNAWAKPKIYNCIFWNNGDEIVNTSGDPNFGPPEEFSNCDVNIQNTLIKNSNGSGANWNLFYGIDDGANIDVDPLFVDELLGDMHLHETSPAINIGDNFLLPPGLLLDLDGNDRIFDFVNGGNVDLGAFEFQGAIVSCTVGAFCDDGDPCTAGETFQADCECTGGTLVDVDNDNICDSDVLDNCVGPNIGEDCDDGDPNTVNDMVDVDCSCIGINPLFCQNLGLSIGDDCNDGDDCTVGETVQSDCTCGGGVLLDDDNDGLCDTDLNDNCVGPNIGSTCDDSDPCTNGETIQPDCNCGGGMLVDVDADGICDTDLADNCLGPNIGSTCDDGDDCTVGESIQDDCNCGGGVLLDDDNDGLCDTDLNDNCVGPNIGSTCDDGDPCTVGESIQDDCNCSGGVLLDDDTDGICDMDAADNCIGPNIGDDCDDGDPETIGDVINTNCQCDGLVSNQNLENQIPSIQLFPNPAHSVLFIDIKNTLNTSGNIKIFNSLGQLLDIQTFYSPSVSPVFFDVKNYTAGIYFIQVQLETEQIISGKFLITK